MPVSTLLHQIIAAAAIAAIAASGTAQIRTFSRPSQAQAAGAAAADIQPPEAPAREFRGAWISTVANLDWPQKGASSASQQRAFLDILDKCVEVHLNAIVFQVRPVGDAFYDSKLEPWSEFLTGVQGQAPSPMYDPLEFAVSEAHKRGIEVHAWLNPYRASSGSTKTPKAPTHLSNLRPDLVKEYGKHLWMDPGEPEVTQHTLNVVMDIVNRYDVDGIHFDDYFYPYKERDAAGKILPFPDDPAWAKYQATGGTLTRDDWRRESVNRLVLACHQNIRATKPHVKFGMSPFGSWRPNNPPGAKTMDAYSELYADSRKWWHEGWVDYMTPQIYWTMNQPGHGFPIMFNWWIQENRKQRHLWPGMFTSNVALKPQTWSPDEIVNQILTTRKQQGPPGQVHFRVQVFMKNSHGLNQALLNGPYAGFALVPAMPWKDATPPAQPRVELTTVPGDVPGSQKAVVKWGAGDTDPVKHWCLYQRSGSNWTWAPIGPDQTEFSVDLGKAIKPDALAISALDRAGNESERAIVPLP